MEVVAERLDDLRGLVLPQQAVVDEDAGQLVADRLVDEERRDRRVDAARERAEHALAPDLGADPLDLLLDHRGGRPGRGRVGDRVEEVLQQVVPVRRVHDLGVELDAVETPLGSSNAAIGVDGDDATTREPSGGAVTESRWLIQPICSDGRFANSSLVGHELGLAELRDAGSLDAPAELLGHQLHPVADAERRDRRARRCAGRPSARPRRRPMPGPPDRTSASGSRAPAPRARSVRHELGVDAALAHAPRDQLRVLAAAVQNEHRPLLGGRLRRRQRDDVAHPIPMCCACCSTFPSVLIDGASMISAFWKSWIDS